jgi:hypothetical protein
LIAMLLIKYLQLKATFGWSLSNFVALLRQQLFVYRDLWAWIDHPIQYGSPSEEESESLAGDCLVARTTVTPTPRLLTRRKDMYPQHTSRHEGVSANGSYSKVLSFIAVEDRGQRTRPGSRGQLQENCDSRARSDTFTRVYYVKRAVSVSPAETFTLSRQTFTPVKVSKRAIAQ